MVSKVKCNSYYGMISKCTRSLIIFLLELCAIKIYSTNAHTTCSISDTTCIEEAVSSNDSMETTIILDNTTNLTTLCLMWNISLENCYEELMGSSEDGNSSTTVGYFRFKDYTVIYVTVAMISSLFGLIGNAIVLIVSFRDRKDSQSCKLHIAELALVNFIFSIIQLINSAPLYWTNKWIYGFHMCKILRSLMEVGSFLTVALILTICIERYFLIVHPIDNIHIEGRIQHIAVIVSIFVVLATVVPYYLGLGIEPETGRCVMFYGRAKTLLLPYHWSVVFFYFLIPISVMLVAYGSILRAIQKRDFNNTYQEETVVRNRLKQNRRIVRITISILIIFIVCTLPTRLFLIYLEMIHYDIADMNTYFILTFIGYVLYPLQNTLNPILYSVVDQEWRKGLKNSLKCFTDWCNCSN